MSDPQGMNAASEEPNSEPTIDSKRNHGPERSTRWWRPFNNPSRAAKEPAIMSITSSDGYDDIKGRPEKWSLGVLNDKETDEVPGSCSLHGSNAILENLGWLTVFVMYRFCVVDVECQTQ